MGMLRSYLVGCDKGLVGVVRERSARLGMFVVFCFGSLSLCQRG